MATKTRKVIALKPTTRKDGSLSYMARYFHPDYTHCEKALSKGDRFCSGHTKGTVSDSEAEALAKGWALQAELGGNGKPMISTDPDTVTMNELCGLWLTSNPIKPKASAMRKYAERWRAMTNRDPVIGMTPVASVTKARIIGWLSESREVGHAASTMKQDLILLRHVAQYAVVLDLIAEDFTAGIKPPASVQGKPTKSARLTPDQVRAVAAHIGGTLGDAIILDLYTGLRLAELLGLRASDVDRSDPDAYVLRIREQWDKDAPSDDGLGKGAYVIPKTKASVRDVPIMLPEIQHLIGKHLLDYPASHTEHGIMFATRNGTHFLPSNVRKVWHRACREVGLPRVKFHSIRATMIDFWHDAGVTFDQLAPMVGHKDAATTQNVYYRDKTVDDSISAMRSVLTKAEADAAPLAEVVNL